MVVWWACVREPSQIKLSNARFPCPRALVNPHPSMMPTYPFALFAFPFLGSDICLFCSPLQNFNGWVMGTWHHQLAFCVPLYIWGGALVRIQGLGKVM